MTTLEEQLDELLGMASEAGRLYAESEMAEKKAYTSLDRKAGRTSREAKGRWQTAERRLNAARARFLAAHGG